MLNKCRPQISTAHKVPHLNHKKMWKCNKCHVHQWKSPFIKDGHICMLVYKWNMFNSQCVDHTNLGNHSCWLLMRNCSHMWRQVNRPPPSLCGDRKLSHCRWHPGLGSGFPALWVEWLGLWSRSPTSQETSQPLTYTPKFKKYILPTFDKIMYKWCGESWLYNHHPSE